MMDKEFAKKLKATLDAMIAQQKALSERLSAIEHSVNDVIIGGLTEAADTYEDNERYSDFYDAYSESFNPYNDTCKIIYGDDYDIAEELYAGSKDKEDVAAYVAEELQKIQSKLDALKAMNDKADEEPSNADGEAEGEAEEKLDEELDEEELMRIAMEL